MSEYRGILAAPCKCGHTWGKHRGMPPYKCMTGCDCPDFDYQAVTSIDILLFCPNCGEQHIDEAKPDVCEKCGRTNYEHREFEGCGKFTAWLNPPHKSHRCNSCNHVWRPADVPTNGVATIKTSGERDGSAKPRFHKEAVSA